MNTKIFVVATALVFLLACSGNNDSPTANETDPLTDGPLGTDNDTDNDGTIDTNDMDDDNDGFLDVDNISSLDQTVPGDFSSPEAI